MVTINITIYLLDHLLVLLFKFLFSANHYPATAVPLNADTLDRSRLTSPMRLKFGATL